MPYIPYRSMIDEALNPLLKMELSEGSLNYIFTKLLLMYVSNNEKNYSTCNSAIGILECCKLEFYRRLVAPYEDTKIEQNGDVYPSDV